MQDSKNEQNKEKEKKRKKEKRLKTKTIKTKERPKVDGKAEVTCTDGDILREMTRPEL